MPAKILIVDDDPQMRKTLANLLRRDGYTTAEAAGGKEAGEELGRDVFDLVITDLHMEPMSGIDLLRAVKRTHPELEVIVVTAFGTVETAVEAMKLQAFDFITKPFRVDEILHRVRNALEKSRLRDEVRLLRTEAQNAFGVEGIVGHSEAMRKILSVLPRVAQTDSTVLITGESGTGKELIARAVGMASRRASGPFISVSCAALPEQTLEDELFGHVKGAFTTAVAARKGLLEEASGGTFFFDEIGEVPPSIQVKLLRVLEERSIRRLGDNRSIPVDVRFVAATNQNLEESVKAGRFRADLFFRLNVVRLKLPPLRERVEDIPLLIAHFIDTYGRKMGRPAVTMSPEAGGLMMGYSWPGNVRELANVIESMIALAAGDDLDVCDLPESIRGGPGREAEESHGPKPWQPAIDQVEKNTIVHELERHNGNVTRTARSLGISRATLQNKMKKYRLRRDPPA